MNDVGKSQEVFGRLAEKAAETLTLWAEAHQRVLREMADLSAAATKEAVHLYTDLGSGAVGALRESQAWWQRRQAEVQDLPKDPVGWYQKGVVDSIEGTQKALRFMEGGAQAVSRSAERLSSTVERAGTGIQDTFATLAAKMQEIYAAA
jgi:hypothetical protein